MMLSAEQEAVCAAVEDEWLPVALATGAGDRDAVAAGVLAAYRAARLPEPERIVWLDSPRAGAIAAAVLTETGGSSKAVATAGTGCAAPVTAALRAQGWRIGVDPGPSLRSRLRTTPWARARERAVARLGPDGWARLSAAAGRRSWNLVMDLVAGRLRTRLGADLAGENDGTPWPAAARGRLLDAVYGQFDAAWLTTFAAADRLWPEAEAMSGLTGLATVARGAGWWWPFARVAVLTARPTTLVRDNLGRLHSGEEAALGYPDGYGVHAWRGMPIPADLVAQLSRLTVEQIRSESNAEVRRVMMEHFGYDRYLREAGASRVAEDPCGVLWRAAVPGDEPLVMVEVVNATPEPDGTRRRYWLRVPPDTRTAREGVAWTFGLTAEEYAPLAQT